MSPPPYLYRYQKFDERTVSIIVNHALYFAHADQFNDPFDCRIRFNYEGTDADWEKKLRKTPSGFPDLTPAQIQNIIEQIRCDPERDKRVHEWIEDNIRKQYLADVGICCFSADPAQMLMWSHYADSHRGCCLQFSTKQNYFETAFQVDYPDAYPNFNYFEKAKNDMELIRAMLSTKSSLWAYEQEWRMLEFEGSQKLYPFEPRDLTGIILGHWMSPDHKRLIQRLVQKFDPPVCLYQAVPKEREFKMEIIPVP